LIVLVGFMGAGKTAVGRELALQTGLPFVDTDHLIEQRAGRSINDIFEKDGEAGFRDLERQVVADVLDGPEAVVALGGGALGDPGTCAALEWANVVLLDTSLPEVLRRLKDDDSRPLLRRMKDPRALYEERLPVYRRMANFEVRADGRAPADVANEIARLVFHTADAPVGTRKVTVPVGDGGYEILIGNGIADRVGELMPDLPAAERAFVVTHPSLDAVARRVAGSLDARGLRVRILPVPEGEPSKSLAVAAQLFHELAEAPAHRGDLVVSVGGGVVGDLSGFVASTYARGVRLLHVPTSLLAQVDAAIGGKTAINLPQGKNLVGTFHQPVQVICDVGVLATLPDVEMRSGLAEVVKYGFISDPAILDVVRDQVGSILGRDPKVLEDIVARSAWAKASFVGADERDHGVRAHLNYGHTFAHSIEHAASFTGIRHGEAVALGMVAAARLARELDRIDDDLVDLHVATLRSAGLPTSAELRLEDLEPGWLRDKKYERGVRFVLLASLGKPEAGITAERRQIERALEKMAP